VINTGEDSVIADSDLGDAEKVPNARIAGATPVWEWAGSDATVFSPKLRLKKGR